MSKIITKVNDGVLVIELNNASKLNCIGYEMLVQLNNAVDKAKEDEDVKVILIKGSGDRAFSTGADLKEFKTLSKSEEVRWIEFGNDVFNKIESLTKPTIAFIDGYALGGGLELALACDFRIGTSRAIFSSPELQHGWLPGWGGMTRMRRLLGEKNTKEIVFLCQQIDAKKALEVGLLTIVVENESCEGLKNMLQHLKSIDTKAFSLAKVAIADENRTTRGVDVQYDVLAMQLAQQVNK